MKAIECDETGRPTAETTNPTYYDGVTLWEFDDAEEHTAFMAEKYDVQEEPPIIFKDGE